VTYKYKVGGQVGAEYASKTVEMKGNKAFTADPGYGGNRETGLTISIGTNRGQKADIV